MKWLEVPMPERVEIVRQGLAIGLTYREIAGQFSGATKNSVLSLARRVCLHHGNAHKFVLTDKRAKREPLSYEARKRANARQYAQRRRDGRIKGYKGATRRKQFINHASDPLTREAVAMVNTSGLTDECVAERAGIHRTTIGQWRHGRSKAVTYLAQCVIEAVTVITESKTDG